MKKTTPPRSKYDELSHHLDILNKILAPELIGGIRKLVSEAIGEIRQQAKDERMRPELQQLEPLLELFRDSIRFYGDSKPNRYLWRMRPVIKKIIEVYAPPKS